MPSQSDLRYPGVQLGPKSLRWPHSHILQLVLAVMILSLSLSPNTFSTSEGLVWAIWEVRHCIHCKKVRLNALRSSWGLGLEGTRVPFYCVPAVKASHKVSPHSRDGETHSVFWWEEQPKMYNHLEFSRTCLAIPPEAWHLQRCKREQIQWNKNENSNALNMFQDSAYVPLAN